MNPAPAQKILVERFISWDKIRERLTRYPAIARAFPIGLLERQRKTPPYFCHYMAWRLGVWSSEALFKRLEELLQLAESLPAWASERPLLETAEYPAFWSLVWQLQIAEHLNSVGSDLRWCGSGPDLAVKLDGDVLYVECYSYRKSLPQRIFLEDVLTELGGDIKMDHNWFMPFSLPSNQEASAFLDRRLTPFLDEPLIEGFREQAKTRWPVKVVEPASSLLIYLEGPIEAYDPSIHMRQTSDPVAYIEVILREAIGNKAGSNQLADHRPNLLAVSYLLSSEAQTAFNLRDIPRTVELGDAIDALTISTAGIDVRLRPDDLILVAERQPPNPKLSLISRSV